jgi:hypothetical protein
MAINEISTLVCFFKFFIVDEFQFHFSFFVSRGKWLKIKII